MIQQFENFMDDWFPEVGVSKRPGDIWEKIVFELLETMGLKQIIEKIVRATSDTELNSTTWSNLDDKFKQELLEARENHFPDRYYSLDGLLKYAEDHDIKTIGSISDHEPALEKIMELLKSGYDIDFKYDNYRYLDSNWRKKGDFNSLTWDDKLLVLKQDLKWAQTMKFTIEEMDQLKEMFMK